MSALVLQFPSDRARAPRTDAEESAARMDALTAILRTSLDGIPRPYPKLASNIEEKAMALAAKFVARFDEARAVQS